MSQGQLWLFNKIKQSGFYRKNVTLDIVNTFNMEENLNDTPSNMKVKVVTSNTYREEFEVNTIAYHPDTTTWWVIKSDTSAYLHTGEYEHEIELVELLEFYSYRHLPNCAFAPNTYTLDQMLTRVFAIGKQTDISVVSPYPSFLDSGKQMPFLSFENFTIANAIKTIARSINAIPKVFGTLVTGEVPYIQNFKLTFINRNGNETAIDSQDLNTKFPIAYEHNSNSSDQFLTRSVSNISNAKSSALVIAPQRGGFKNITPNSPDYVVNDAKVFLPSKIEKIEFVRIFAPIKLIAFYKPTGITELIYESYYVNVNTYSEKLINHPFLLRIPTSYTLAQKQAMSGELPQDVSAFQQVNFDTLIDKDYDPSTSGFKDNIFFKKMTILNKFNFETENDDDRKNRTIHWNPVTNEMIMPLSFRNGLFGGNDEDHNRKYRIYNDSDYEVYLTLSYTTVVSSPFAVNIVKNDSVLIQVGYYPIADIKVSYDNDNDAQDEKFFNQSGKVIDTFSTSQLIISHTNDSVEGTKIRNARYDDYANIVPLGQIVRDNNELYIVSQRSIDMMFRDNGNNYFNVIYTLSKNRVARSENIQADSAVINYKTPDDNLVKRSQLYKDYIELSLVNITPKDIPYLSMGKALVINSQFVGTEFDFTVLAKNTYDSTTIRYVQSPTIFDLAKAKLFNVNWQDNNVLGFRLDSTGSDYIQTPIVYTNDIGKATNFELLVCDTTNITDAKEFYNDNYTPNDLIPFGDLTNVNDNFYTDSVIDENHFSMRIEEPTYDKDPFEIPVFEYMIQGNDDYNALGNVIIGNELFTSYRKTSIVYNYVVSTTRFTAENANRLFTASSPAPSSFVQRVVVDRTNATTINLKLYSQIIVGPPPTLNTTALQGKHIGIFAVGSDSTRKFLFAINDYNMVSNNDINLYINNWKI
jgi:hypothetical protein